MCVCVCEKGDKLCGKCNSVNMWQAAGKRFLQRNASLLRQLKAQRRLQRALANKKVRCVSNLQNLHHLDTFYRAMRPCK